MTTFFLHEKIYRDLGRVADARITICGAGALGANLAETLARMGLRKLRVIDRDRVAAHNLSTQPWTQQDVGTAKVRVLANALYRAVGARVEGQHVELGSANAQTLLEHSAVVVDAFDNIPSRVLVRQTVAALGVPCLHLALGADGRYGCGLWNDAYVLPQAAQGDDGCDYPLTRPLALLVVAAGAEVLVRQLLGQGQHGFEATLGDLRLLPTR
jgi:molybdopterin-synthase adenylyltransferase